MSLQTYRRPGALAAVGSLAYQNRNTIIPYINRGFKRFRQSLNHAPRNGARMRRTNRRGPSYSGQGITNQHDVTRIYRKRYMPRYKKRRWRKFVRRVHAVAEKDLGSRTYVINSLLQVTSNTLGAQGCATVCLYPNTSTDGWLNDLNNISLAENLEADPTTAAGITVERSTKFLFQSGVLDMTVRNSSFQTGASGVGVKLEVDVYELTMRKDAYNGTIQLPNMSDLLSAMDADTKRLAGTGSSINIALRGVSPWDITYALSRYGIKIHKKKKYFLEAGGTFTYQVRDPSRYSLDQNDMRDKLGFNRPKMTRIIYFIFKAVPGFTIGSEPGEYQQQLDIGITRKYLYKIEGANDDRDRYVGDTYAENSPS